MLCFSSHEQDTALHFLKTMWFCREEKVNFKTWQTRCKSHTTNKLHNQVLLCFFMRIEFNWMCPIMCRKHLLHMLSWTQIIFDFPAEACKMDYFAYNRLQMLMFAGKKLNKQEKNQTEFFLGFYYFYFWDFLVWHLVGESLGTGNTRWGSEGNAVCVCEQWAHLGHHWIHTGTGAVKQSKSEVDIVVYHHLPTFLLKLFLFFFF